ncbi:MAG: hypothetical protein ABR881_00545 [Candidatus Sulfotelmatobacter sp.]
MTKKQVCELLCISPKTLQRRIAKGQYKFTSTGEGQFAELSFTHADLGLIEPVPVPEPTPEPVPALETAPAAPAAPTPEPKFAPTPLGPIELQREADERFAQDYKRGLATDSLGNTIGGTNDSRPTLGAVSLIGPSVDASQRPAIDTQAHMTSPIGDSDAINAPRHSFDKGLSDDDLAAMRSDWKRRGGGLSMSEQRQAIERSKANINEAFNYARRQR